MRPDHQLAHGFGAGFTQVHEVRSALRGEPQACAHQRMLVAACPDVTLMLQQRPQEPIARRRLGWACCCPEPSARLMGTGR